MAERIDFENLDVPADFDAWPLTNRLRWFAGVFGETGGRRLSATLTEAATELILAQVPGGNFNRPADLPPEARTG